MRVIIERNSETFNLEWLSIIYGCTTMSIGGIHLMIVEFIPTRLCEIMIWYNTTLFAGSNY